MSFKFLKEDEAFERIIPWTSWFWIWNALVKWKNLTPIQDPGRVYTIADYKNKQYQLYHVGICGGNRASDGPPGKSYFWNREICQQTFLSVWREAWMRRRRWKTRHFARSERMVAVSLQEDFKRLNQNYQDYLRDFYSGKSRTADEIRGIYGA